MVNHSSTDFEYIPTCYSLQAFTITLDGNNSVMVLNPLTLANTFARKTPASITALIWRSQPEFSRPVKKSLIEGDFISHTVKKEHTVFRCIMKEEKKGRSKSLFITFHQLLKAVPHHMYIFNTDELEMNVGVIIFILVSLSSSSVGHCVQLMRNKIDNHSVLSQSINTAKLKGEHTCQHWS